MRMTKEPRWTRAGRGCLIAATLEAILLSTAVAQPLPPEIDGVVGDDRGRIGLQVQPMTPELREHFKAPKDRGLLVSRVDPDRPGAAAGIEVGDVLLEGDGQALVRPFDLMRIVTRMPHGEVLELTAIRDGDTLTFRVSPEGEGMPWLDPGYWRDWAQKGLQMGSEELRKQLRDLEQRLEEFQRRLEKLERESEEREGQRT